MRVQFIITTIILATCFGYALNPASLEAESGVETDESEGFDETFDADDAVFEFDTEETKTSFLSSLFSDARFTLKHEVFYKVKKPTGIMSNRSSLRLELSKPIGRYLFLQLDTKETFFWKNDHRAEAVDKKVTAEPFTREAFLQASFADTSIKAGIQILIWGESEGGAITDVISPRDYSEAFFISLEESRIGQPMMLLDQFTPFGDVSLFFVPDANFNEYPEKNTAYEEADAIPWRTTTSDSAGYEFGGRWKKAFGQSDVAVMLASLIENDYTHRLDGFTASGEMMITREKNRFAMAGVAFNHVRGSFLYKGEVGIKWPQHFNDASLQIEKKDVLDMSLGVDYSPGGAYTLSLELANRYILKWEADLAGVRENETNVALIWDKTFLNETLSVNWMTIHTFPDKGFIHTLRTAYDWNDYLTFEFEIYLPDIYDTENIYWIYHDQKQVALKLQFQM